MPGALEQRIDELWEVFGDRDSLFPTLAADAVLARARADELAAALPRLLELTVTDSLDGEPLTSGFELLRAAEWQTWPAERQRTIEAFADTWWADVRTSETPIIAPGEVLACLAHLDLPPVRWLAPWLDDLDGPAARHLADVVIQQLPEPAWSDRVDQRAQILGWTRTEPVILGLTLVGGVHLDEGHLGRALDRML